MTRKQTIQQFTAILLLLVFSISITPKSVFHDLISDHEDAPSCTDPVKSTAHLHNRTYECHFDNLVVTVPYFLTETEVNLPAPVYFLSFSETVPAHHLPQHYLRHESRGPPVV